MPKNHFRVENREHEFDDIPTDPNEFQAFVEKLRHQIEPWLSAIFQSEHLALLVGNGLSAGLADAIGATAATMRIVSSFYPALDTKISAAAEKSAKSMGRSVANLEDQIRSCLTLLAGLEIIGDPQVADLRKGLQRALVQFANSIVKMEASILDMIKDKEKERSFRDLLASFLLSFASRAATRDRLHIFTTNYDRIIEYGFDIVGIHPVDRFVGGLSPIFRSSRFDVDIHYNPQGARLEARPLEGVVWPAPGSEDTKLGVFMGPEVSDGEAKIYARVQA